MIESREKNVYNENSRSDRAHNQRVTKHLPRGKLEVSKLPSPRPCFLMSAAHEVPGKCLTPGKADDGVSGYVSTSASQDTCAGHHRQMPRLMMRVSVTSPEFLYHLPFSLQLARRRVSGTGGWP